ncbi:MAG: heavy metal translocating P-type ATPase, partial [Methanobacteriaceae archaeon]
MNNSRDDEKHMNDENSKCNNKTSHSCSCGCGEGILSDLGEDDEDNRDNINNTEYEHKIDKTPLIKLAVGGLIFLIGLFIELNFPNTVIATIPVTNSLINIVISIELQQIILLLIVPIVGYNIIKKGILSLVKGHITINLLVIIATTGAFLLGEVFEGAMLILLFFLAEYLEDYALDKSKRSISQLLNLAPEIAIKKEKRDGGSEGECQVPVKSLKIDDIVVVKPGEKVPIDGIVIKGETYINQASITGESLAVKKTVGDEVYGSTINEEGYIEVKVSKSPDNTV